jgi:hypothetical protein
MFHPIFGEAVERVPRLGIKGNAFANTVVACLQVARLLLRSLELRLRDDNGRTLFLLEDDDRSAAARLPGIGRCVPVKCIMGDMREHGEVVSIFSVN